MPIIIDQPSTVRSDKGAALDIKPEANRVRRANSFKDPIVAEAMAQAATAFEKIQSAFQGIENLLRKAAQNTLENLFITAPGGALIGWIGTYQGYQGAWFKRLYVGGIGPDAAPFFANANGEVVIGKAGSVSIQALDESEVGYLGVKLETQKVILTATNATPPVIGITAHGYKNGDTVYITGATGNTNIKGYRLVKNVTANTFEITTIAGVNVIGNGAYAGPGRAARYFAGGWFQSFAAGGTGFDNAKIRSYVNGDVKITNALISLVNGTRSITFDPSGPVGVFADTATNSQVYIAGGYILIQSISGSNPMASLDRSRIQLINSGGLVAVVDATVAADNGLLIVSNFDGTKSIGLAGVTGTVTADNVNAETTLQVSGTVIVDSVLNAKNLASVDSASYKAAGVPGISTGQPVGVSLTVTSGSAVDSVDFGASTTTSTSVVTSVVLNTVTRNWSQGLLTV